MRTRKDWLARVAFVLLGAYGALSLAPVLADVNRATFGGGGLGLGGGTVTGPILFPDGTAGAPSIAWASDADGTGTGFYRSGANIVDFTANGANYVEMGVLRFSLSSATILSWTNGAASATVDTSLLRESAAVFQLGSDNGASAAIDQTVAAADAITAADISGGDLTIQSGTGMGTGAVSALIFQTPTVAAAGANAQSLATRLTVSSAGAVSTVNYTAPGSAFAYTILNRGSLGASADGVWALLNNSGVGATLAAKTISAVGGPPTVSACGATPSAVTGTNIAGKLTTGSGGTVQSCTITFVPAYTTAPACTCNDETAIVVVRATTTTTTLVCDTAVAGTLESDVVSYQCLGGS